jgi:hypothetical protein
VSNLLLTSKVTFNIFDKAVFCQSSNDFGVTSIEGLGDTAFTGFTEVDLMDGDETAG